MVITGALRVAGESILSDLDNLAVYTVLARSFSTCFGFTQREVETLLAGAGSSASMADMHAWYGGHIFGDTVIYNPWSILGFIDHRDGMLQPYWAANDLVRRMLEPYPLVPKGEIEELLVGGRVEKIVHESVVFEDLDGSADALWSRLLFSGNLKAEPGPSDPREPPHYWLSIPNLDVREGYVSALRDHLVVAFDGKKVQVRSVADRSARRPARKKAARPRKKATTKRRS